MRVRYADADDHMAIADLFTRSVHGLAGADYSVSQRSAWAPVPPDYRAWKSRLSDVHTLVCLADDVICGFISFSSGGHIQHLFTSPEKPRSGVATRLFNSARDILVASKVTVFTTEASLTARPFFERQGFVVTEEQLVSRQDERLKRFAMRYELPGT